MCIQTAAVAPKGLRDGKVRSYALQLIYEGKEDHEVAEELSVRKQNVAELRRRYGIYRRGATADSKRRDPQKYTEGRLTGFSNEAELWGWVIRNAVEDVLRCCKEGVLDASGSSSLHFLEGGGNFNLAVSMLQTPPQETSKLIIDSILARSEANEKILWPKKRKGKTKTPDPQRFKRALCGVREFQPKYQSVAKVSPTRRPKVEF